MIFRRLLRFGVFLSLFWLPLPLAQAHAELVASNPVAGAHLDVMPTKIDVTFDGNLLSIGSAKTNVLIVKDPQGREIDAKNSQVSGTKLSVAVNPVTVSGFVTVSWRVVSSDGHPEQGSYQFTVGNVASISVPTLTTPISPTPAATTNDVPAEGFWSRYGTRLMLLLAGAVGIGIWIRFERARRKLR